MTNNILLRNNVKIFGSGEQVIFFAHGFGCDQNMWRFITPSFIHQYKVIVFDYVGCGGSDISAYNKDRYASLHGYAQDVTDICEALKCKDIIFVGHSVSSMIGLLASLYAPQYFKSLIMIGPSPCYVSQGDYVGGFSRRDVEGLLETMDKNYIGWANFMGPSVMANPESPELGEELKDSFCATDPIIARRFAEVTFLSDNREDIKRIKISSLIMQCAEDIIAPIEVGYYMEKNMPGSKLHLMKATGHCPHLSAPEETISIIENYLHTAN